MSDDSPMHRPFFGKIMSVSQGVVLEASPRQSPIRHEQGLPDGLVRSGGRSSLDQTWQHYGLDVTSTRVSRSHPSSSPVSSRPSLNFPHSNAASPDPAMAFEQGRPPRETATVTSHAASLPPPRAFLSPKKPTSRNNSHGLGPRIEQSSDTVSAPSRKEWAQEGSGALSLYARTKGFPSSTGQPDHELSSDRLIIHGHYGSRSSNEQTASTLEEGDSRLQDRTFSSRSSADTEQKANDTREQPHTAARHTRLRKYELLSPSGVSFFLNGRLMTGGDSPLPVLASLTLLCGVGGCWLGTTGVWLWRDGRRYGLGSGGIAVVVVFGYLLSSSLTSMAAAAFRDPGILPRRLDLHPPISHMTSTDSLIPLARELKVREQGITVKYCDTCKIYRPPRSSHCRLCGNCVDGIDHHCTYLHTCIGKRNYVSFLAFVVWITFATIYEVVFSALHFALLCSTDEINFKTALSRSPGAAVSFAFGIVVIWPVLALLGYHFRLVSLNSTTIEQIRSSGAKALQGSLRGAPSPFSYPTILRNLLSASIGRPRLPSWLDARGYAKPETRSLNPGVLSV